MHRSTTDLTVDLCFDDSLFNHTVMEIHKQEVSIVEIHAKQMESKLLLIIVLSNRRIIAYENLSNFPDIKNQKFRFKIIQSQVLRKTLSSE